MASSTNRFSSPSRPSGDHGAGKQNGTPPLLNNNRNNQNSSDEVSRESSHPHPLVPPTILQPSNKEVQLRLKNLRTGRSTPASSSNSIVSSRETSPVPRFSRPSNQRSLSQSRKNSQELSPARSSSGTSLNQQATTHSIPAVIKTLVESGQPLFPPPTDSRKQNMVAGDWPRSPRLKSCPPVASSAQNNIPPSSLLKPESDISLANISSKRLRNREFETEPFEKQSDEENLSRSMPRNLRSGSVTGSVLETVDEAGTPTIPKPDPIRSWSKDKPLCESGSDSSTNKARGVGSENKHRNLTSTPKPDMVPKRSFTSLSSARGKQGETSMTNMTVETETVSSVPQAPLGGGTSDRGGPGTLRLRPSDETIRPKKEKRKLARKVPVQPGALSTKADIFEAKVANAVDNAYSSDSEETFVYESNPPDAHPARQHRFHSRTPSTASMVSQLDQYGGRARGGLRDGLPGISGKRSMKFTNNTYNTFDGEGEEQGVGRGSSRAGAHMHSTRHNHTGRHGRPGGHATVFDHARFFSAQGNKSSRHFPANGNRHTNSNIKKDGDTYGYDFDAEGADDERAPLVGSRGLRSRQGRRPNSSSLRQMEYLEQRRKTSIARYGLCALLLVLVALLGAGATIFIVGITKPLVDVQVIQIQNVLASEQELMLDLNVLATNPNLFPLTISHIDVNLFAKSRFLGSESFSIEKLAELQVLPRTSDSRSRAILARTAKNARRLTHTSGVDKGTDPMPSEPIGDPLTMLLGRVFYFYSPLTFEPSPWKYTASNATGQIRLKKPGNRTEEGGSSRWERVLQNPFELIVRGVVNYHLPLSSSMQSASISSKIQVLPDKDNGNTDKNTTQTSLSLSR
ncbi:hypothetical protein FQN57_002801 [Myotisia sp. PD_48]|nr:hypothetical protein FQN57_002801 [Myotisia sp. PD_48]